jgi:hypothetical protein
MGVARINFAGTVIEKEVSYQFQMEALGYQNENSLHALDWNAAYTFDKTFRITMGRMLIPYSRESYSDRGHLLFHDFSLANYALSPDRAIGAMISGSYEQFSYYSAVTNRMAGQQGPSGDGYENNTQDFKSSMGDVEKSNSKYVSAMLRLEFDLVGNPKKGGDEIYGFQGSLGKFAKKPAVSWGFAGAYNPVNDNDINSALVAGDVTYNWTSDLGIRYHIFSMEMGYLGRMVDAYEDRTDMGVYGQMASLLGKSGVMSQLELAGRFARTTLYEINLHEYSGAVNYYIAEHNAKCQLVYVMLHNPDSGNIEGSSVHLQVQVLF